MVLFFFRMVRYASVRFWCRSGIARRLFGECLWYAGELAWFRDSFHMSGCHCGGMEIGPGRSSGLLIITQYSTVGYFRHLSYFKLFQFILDYFEKIYSVKIVVRTKNTIYIILGD